MINARQIKDLLAARRWNQVKLAEECHVTQATVSRWVGGTQQPDPPALAILTKLINETPRLASDNLPANAPTTSAVLKALLDAVRGSYLMLGLEQDEADALLKLVIEVSEEQPTPSAGQDFHRVQSEREVRKFLKSIDFRLDGA